MATIGFLVAFFASSPNNSPSPVFRNKANMTVSSYPATYPPPPPPPPPQPFFSTFIGMALLMMTAVSGLALIVITEFIYLLVGIPVFIFKIGTCFGS